MDQQMYGVQQMPEPLPKSGRSNKVLLVVLAALVPAAFVGGLVFANLDKDKAKSTVNTNTATPVAPSNPVVAEISAVNQDQQEATLVPSTEKVLSDAAKTTPTTGTASTPAATTQQPSSSSPSTGAANQQQATATAYVPGTKPVYINPSDPACANVPTKATSDEQIKLALKCGKAVLLEGKVSPLYTNSAGKTAVDMCDFRPRGTKSVLGAMVPYYPPDAYYPFKCSLKKSGGIITYSNSITGFYYRAYENGDLIDK